MANVTPLTRKAAGSTDFTYTTLDGSSDQFSFKNATQQVLILKNDTGGSLTPVLVGNATSYNPPGYEPALDTSGGYDMGSISDGTSKYIYLSSIKEILGDDGLVAINSGVGLEAVLLEG